MEIKGRTIFKGTVEGEALVSSEPISFYGGVDPDTGEILEKGHDLQGKSIIDKILVFPNGKGSTVGSYILYRMKKNGTSPLAIIVEDCETVVAVGVIISEIPCVDKVDILKIKNGDKLKIKDNLIIFEK
jgi:hypothetical protein